MEITLGQLLQYYDDEQAFVERIQIVTEDHDWNDADELFVGSDLLSSFTDWIVYCMFCEKSFYNGTPIIRVGIRKQHDIFTVHVPELNAG